MERLKRLGVSAPFAYGSIAVIQGKVLWGIWSTRDLTPGDTAGYFVDASRWAEHLQVDPAFYPLYDVFWGSLKWLVADPFAVTILHRVLIALAASLVLLAVLRRLLTPGIAWLLALWWATLPATYDVLYEDHLFGALAGLGIVWVALRWSGLAARSAVFGLLLASALLVRNEYVVAALIFAAVWMAYEVRSRSRCEPGASGRIALAAAVPLLAAVILFGLVSWRDQHRRSVFDELAQKQGRNVCGTYARQRWQSGDVLVENPLRQCFAYTLRDFGIKYPTLPRAAAENPRAVARHLIRNAALFPAGLEVNLFNAKFGSDSEAANPDFIPVENGSWVVLIGSLTVLAVIGAGTVIIWRDRRSWWEEWIHSRVWGWVTLGALGAAALWAGLETRPRPSYLLPLSALLFAWLGMSAMAIARRFDVPERAAAAIPPLALAAVILIPPHYRDGYENPQIGPGQRLRTAVARLEPFRHRIQGWPRVLLAPYPATGACEYVGESRPCSSVVWNYPLGESLGPELEGRRQQGRKPRYIDFVYADENVFGDDPSVRTRLERLQRHGWRRLGGSGDDWMLLGRETR
jgi:hypothetical protein